MMSTSLRRTNAAQFDGSFRKENSPELLTRGFNKPEPASDLIIPSRFRTQNDSFVGKESSSFSATPTTVVGFASLPNQVHRKSIRRGFTFNLMITGCPGLGKSSLINALFCSGIYDGTKHPGPSYRSSDITRVDVNSFNLTESGVNLHLSILDTPEFGQALDCSNCWNPIVDYLNAQFEAFLSAEYNISRRTVGSGLSALPVLSNDTRVHACLYVLRPCVRGLHALDIETMKRLHDKVNLIPIIGKADTLTQEECTQVKKLVRDELECHAINYYNFFPPDSDGAGGGGEAMTEKNASELRAHRARQPFAVISSDKLIKQADGRQVYGRVYPWGIVETENLAHNDFSALKQLLLDVHLHDLIYQTHWRHYDKFYTSWLMNIAMTSNFPVDTDSHEPLYELDAERSSQQQRLENLEKEMNAVFELKVKERTTKLVLGKQELEERTSQLAKQLTAEQTEFKEHKHEFEERRAEWEAANRATLESLAVSMDKLDSKDKRSWKMKGIF